MDTLDILDKDHARKLELIERLSSETFRPSPYSALNDLEFRSFVISSLKKPSEKIHGEAKGLISRTLYDIEHPVLLIQNDDFIFPESKDIAKLLKDNKAAIQAAIRASGRVERGENNFFGTAWVIDKGKLPNNRHYGIAATNRHVVEDFLKNSTGSDIVINFKGEHKINTASKFKVIKVLHSGQNIDIAFLQLQGENLPAPISIADQPFQDERVCVIGYPAIDKDDRNAIDIGSIREDVVRHVFNYADNVKQLSIGEARKADHNIFYHYCNTLGGNSGSVVFSLSTSKAIGIHYKGIHGNDNLKGKNYAIHASEIKSQLMEAKKNLS